MRVKPKEALQSLAGPQLLADREEDMAERKGSLNALKYL